MKSAPKPDNETARLEALYRYKILDTPAEHVFDEITNLAAVLCDVPIATITLIDEDREWYKSRVGIEEEQASRDISFCAHTILQDDVFIVQDTFKDDRFHDNPFVKEDPPLRFYAGASLITPDGYNVGTLCVMDHVPRRLGKHQINSFRVLAQLVVAQLEIRKKTTDYFDKKSKLFKEDAPIGKSAYKQPEEILRLEKEILSNMTEGFVLTRAEDGIIMFTTPQFERLFGYKPGELNGEHVSILNSPTDQQPEETAKKIIEKLNKQGQWDGEIKNIKKDGTSFWCYANVTQFEHQLFGKVWLAVHKDITEIKRTERILSESELRFRTAMDNSPIGMALVSPEGSWLVINKALTQIVGYSRNELLEIDFQTITHPDDLDTDMALVQKVLNDEIETYSMEKRYIHKDGHIVWVQLDVCLVRDPNNHPLYFISQIQDITERKITEQLLKDSEEKFQKAFVSSPHLMAINRLSDGRFIEVNTTFEISLGYTKEEVTDKTPIELGIWVNPERRSLYTELLKKNHSVRNFETTVRTKDGVIRTHKLSAEIFNINNEPCIVSIGEDITEHKQIEETLQKVAEGFAVTSSEEFFKLFTQHIGNTLKADYVIVAEPSKDNEDYIKSVTVYHNGKFHDPITYERHGSPCDTIIGKRTKGYGNNVQGLFPDFSLFATLKIEGYVGAPLFNSNGEVQGVIELLYCNPVNNIETLETLLSIFAIRAAAELERSKMENVLRMRNAAFDISTVGFVLSDATLPDNPIIYVNKGFLDLTGYSKAEVIGKNCRFLQGPDTDPETVAEIHDAVSQGKVYRGEILNYRKDESPFWNLLRIEPYYNQEGKLTHFVGTQSDITVQKNVEKALLRNEKLLRFLYEENPTMYFTISSDGNVLSVNTFGAEALGYTVDELTGKSVLQVFPEYEHANVQNKLQNCLINFGELQDWEIQKIRKNGVTLWVKETARAVGTPDGGTAVLVVCRDITQRKRAEKELQMTHRALRVLSQCNDSMIHVSSEQELLDEICKIIVKTGNYQLAWVGYPDQDERKTVTPVAKAGDIKYLDTITVTWSDNQHGHGPTGTAIRTGKPEIIKDVFKDNNFAPWRDMAMKYGFESVVGLPLMHDNIMLGALTIYAVEENAFNEDELNLLIKLSDNLAFGITAQRTEKQRKLSEDEIKQSRQRLRNFATRLQYVREEERSNIAREIHDELGQTLTGMKMDLSWIHKHMPKDQDQISERLLSIISLLDKELEIVRNIAFRLRPALLDDLGLEAAIDWEVQDKAKRMDCDYTVNFNCGKTYKNTDFDTIVFRILQEALTNIARHAKAKNIYVSYTSEDHDIILEIKDDGIGILDEQITSPNSLGLIGMHERAGAIGGYVQIGPRMEGGTRVFLRIPTYGLQE